MTPEQDRLRIANMIRILDYTDAYIREIGKDIKTINRLELNKIMYEFAGEAGIPLVHFQQAFQHVIAESNGIATKFLEPITNKKTDMKKVEPMLPPEMTIVNKKDERDEPTQRTHSQTVKPYISPLNFQK